MPSPVGHALAGAAVHILTARDRDALYSPGRALLVVGAALAADLDFALKLIDGQNHHQGGSHSLLAAVVAGLAVFLAARLRHVPEAGPLGLAAGVGWASHVLLDYLGRDTHPPIGLPAFWPLDGYYKFPWPLFFDIGRTLEWTTVRHNAVAVAWEIVVLLPIPAVLFLQRRRPGRS